MLKRIWQFRCTALVLFVSMASSAHAELLVGTAQTNITPAQAVAVDGQFALRIARNVESPLMANVIVLESQRTVQPHALAIMVACDLVYITDQVLQQVRDEVHKRLPDLDTTKIFLNATHTHTAPVTIDDRYPIPPAGVIQVQAYRALLAERVADAIVTAWKSRQVGSVSWGLGHAVVAYNRRAVYADGSAQMYGSTTRPEFRGLEGYEDHDIGALFFWNQAGQLIGMAVNVACPSQEVESRSAVNADFWHPVRAALQTRYGKDLCVLGWIGAAGDQSPHLMYRKAADERMRKLRGLTRLEEISRRIVRAVDETYAAVKDDRHSDVPLIHQVEKLRLPMRQVTPAEFAAAKAAVEKARADIEKDPQAADRLYRRMKWFEVTVERFAQQQRDPSPTCDMELHVLRIGDAAVCTNRFELFTDYGICIKARSKAGNTFVVQLAGPGTYLPTEKAVRGGHYSAVVESNLVGPEGGQILVDKTVEMINSMWDSAP